MDADGSERQGAGDDAVRELARRYLGGGSGGTAAVRSTETGAELGGGTEKAAPATEEAKAAGQEPLPSEADPWKVDVDEPGRDRLDQAAAGGRLSAPNGSGLPAGWVRTVPVNPVAVGASQVSTVRLPMPVPEPMPTPGREAAVAVADLDSGPCHYEPPTMQPQSSPPQPPRQPQQPDPGRQQFRPGEGPIPQQPMHSGSAQGQYAAPAERPVEEPARPRRARSFIDDGPVVPVQPVPQGWWARTMQALGLRRRELSPEQLAEQRDVALVSQHWPGPRTVAVVNGKGGSGKTPTAVLLSAVFARYGGGGVLAWDNNDTRGTLGWRTEKSPSHEATVRDLVPHTGELMDPRTALSQISRFVHHQSADKFDVLRSNPHLLAAEQRLTREEFLGVQEVTRRYYRLTVMDSGNDESTSNFLLMLDVADLIVVATTTIPDRPESGRLLLEALEQRDDRSRDLAARAVVVVSQGNPTDDPAEPVAARFREFLPAESVVTIPFDPAIAQMALRYDHLAPATQRAWLRAAAAVATQLGQPGSDFGQFSAGSGVSGSRQQPGMWPPPQQ